MASTPLSTMVTVKSSVAKTMPMTLRMVMESSATKTLFGICVSFIKWASPSPRTHCDTFSV
jgi:hypothetical protein